MKKSFFISLLSAVALFANVESVHAQAVQKGNILVDAYVGGPNLISAGFKAISKANDPTITLTDAKSSGLIPIGLKAEYMVSDKFGLGLEGNFANSSLAGTFTNDSSGAVTNAKFAVPRYRIMALANYHFGKSPKLDWYIGGAAGFLGVNLKATGTSTDPVTQAFFDDIKGKSAFIGKVPVSANIHFGTHIYFTDKIGLNLELASSGPLVKGGIAVKI